MSTFPSKSFPVVFSEAAAAAPVARRTAIAEITKTVGGVEYEKSDFLIAEDADDVSTWHLPVKRNGAPDHRLMGAAKAALTVGYRGNKYDGPGKAEALRKLKALYKAEDMEWVEESAAKTPANLREMYGYSSPEEVPYVPWGARSFSDLQAAEQAQEASRAIRDLAYQFGCLVSNVVGDQNVTDKLAGIQTVIDEFSALVTETLGGVTDETTMDAAETFAESEAGHALQLVETDNITATPTPRDPVRLDIALIRPGFGNKRDNHYYPESILRRDSKVFKGAKMYATDHREDEKSVRTEVSQIEDIVGFTPHGEPIARVCVFEPNFAEMVRNRAKAGKLDTLECSILASGRAHRGTIDGKNANIVEVITAAKSVDWVTKGGAGGRALRLAESEKDTDPMKKKPETEVTETQEAAAPATQAESAPVAIAESGATGNAAPAAAPAAPPPAPETDVEELGEAEVATLLAASKLPAAARKKLAEAKYANADALKAAIADEIVYLKEITGSGKPVLFESAPASATTAPRPLAEINKTKDAINAKYLRG